MTTHRPRKRGFGTIASGNSSCCRLGTDCKAVLALGAAQHAGWGVAGCGARGVGQYGANTWTCAQRPRWGSNTDMLRDNGHRS